MLCVVRMVFLVFGGVIVFFLKISGDLDELNGFDWFDMVGMLCWVDVGEEYCKQSGNEDDGQVFGKDVEVQVYFYCDVGDFCLFFGN